MDEREDSASEISGINVTPLVDVSLVLVLVFMMSTPFFIESLVPVNLPRAASSASETQENIAVSLSPEEGYAVNEVRVEKSQLRKELKRQRQATGFGFLLIRADQTVAHGEVEDVMKMGKEAGFQRIALATLPKGW